MADVPQFIENETIAQPAPRPVRSTPRATPRVVPAEPAETKRRWLSTLDGYLLLVTGILLAVGLMMVYSTTFDLSYQIYGDQTTIFMRHLRNLGVALVFLVLLALIDYRIWRRLAVLLLLLTIGALVAVLLFGDNTLLDARRALVNGSFQPGELAELTTVIYMAAWLGSRKTQIRSITFGLIPFAVLVSIIGGLVLLQPDISTAATIVFAAGIMFFLAGADLVQLGAIAVVGAVIAILYLTSSGPHYAQGRVSSYISGTSDLTQADYHIQQAIKAFSNGGWTGVGLGQSKQKFENLPVPHTDSIFAVIGEELGILGAGAVVALYTALVIRGLQVARRSIDSFGMLLAAGLTIWIAVKALLNIAVMTALVPPTGASLPFISFGGSSLVVVMAGVGLILSVARVRLLQNLPRRPITERIKAGANGHRNGRKRIGAREKTVNTNV
ncbi:MAG: cell division protein FtsW [Chloroflexi bacterium]|nr:cell division protein FtsW [Chloroflexota bacterium]